MISKQPNLFQPILELNRSFDASASFVLLRFRRVPTSFAWKLIKKILRVPCLFRCLIFKVRCLSKEGRFVSYHTHATLSTPFLQPVRFFFRPPLRRFLLLRGRPLSRARSSLSRTLDYSIKPPPLCQLLFLLFSPLLYTPPRVFRSSHRLNRWFDQAL